MLNIQERAGYLQEVMVEEGYSAIVIQQPENRLYYSGFSGSNGWLVITPSSRYIITDSRYYTQSEEETPHFELVKTLPEEGKDLILTAVRLIKRIDPEGTIGFESAAMSVKTFNVLRDLLPKVNFLACEDIIEERRLIKSTEEVNRIRQAIYYAEEAFYKVEGKIVEGVTEREIAATIECDMKRAGAQKESFDTIVGAGKNGALPHARVGDTVLKCSDPVVIDWGARTSCGYNSDMTRTVFVGEPDPEMAKIYNIVYEAQQKAIDIVKPGITCHEVDAAAREHIAAAGYGEFFGHGLGHGIGLAVHEGPTVRNNIPTVLKPGMVFSVEPGIYIPGKGGVRIEDLVVVTETGAEVLTSIPKKKMKVSSPF